MFAPLALIAGVLVPIENGQKPLLIRQQDLQIRIENQVARATLDEVFENTTARPLEADYLLQLPDGAAVSDFATWVDGQRVASRVEEKKKAEETYDNAKQHRQQPAMLQESDARTFRMRVDGIPAGGTKRVQVSWAQILPYDGGLVTLRVPLQRTGAAIGLTRIRVQCEDQKRIAEVKLASRQQAKIEQTEKGFVLAFEAKNAQPDEELLLTYRTESSRLGLSFVPFKPEGEESGYFLLLASPQELTSEQDIVHKDVVFVFDTSGSMGQARKIDQAREALKRCLSNLNAEDRFAVIAFSDSLNPFANQFRPASAQNVREAMRFADALQAGGGTNIDAALQNALGMTAEGDRPRVIVFMTDGNPSTGVRDPGEISRRVRDRNQGHARLFTFGVGSDVNRTFLEKLGSENRGGSGFVADGENIDTVVGGFYAKIARPVLSDLSLDFGDSVTVSMQYPDVLPDLYKGSQLVLVGRYRGAGKAEAALLGTLNAKKIRIPFTAQFPGKDDESAFVARLWAQKRIDYLLAQNRLQGERSEAKDEIIALSTRYQIVTPYTSLVAVQPQDQRLAQVFPARVRPGDPVVMVRAPRDSRRVRVRLPFGGEPLEARWDDEQQAFSARFLVPAETPDGSYPIRVEITARDGQVSEVPLTISIDTHAPEMLAWATPVRAGEMLRLHAIAALTPGDVWHAVTARADRGEALKSLFDVRRVTARLWDGREIDVPLEGHGFSALIETGKMLPPGQYPIELVAQDFAGNSSRREVTVEIAP
ncbi:MAG: VIT and vWA domain-containing protein [Myxococcales bacterium]